jgi:N-acetylglucosaminyl-diphospho-decaprenol L-rhamnosyltransferase
VNALPRVSAIIVSFEVRELLRCCLDSLCAQRGVEVETWVVDNASRDGSAEMVSAGYPAVRLLSNASNVGYATANNQALKQATGDWLLLLNPDTELPPGALAELVQVFRRHPQAGAVGLALRNPDGSPQASCLAFPGLWNQMIESAGLQRFAMSLGRGTPSAAPPPANGEGEVDWVAGACLCLSRAAYSAVGGLDERLFMYGEEPDWCWRARCAGFATVWSEAARVLHHGGASGEGLRGKLFVRNLEARLAFLRHHRGAWQAAVAREVMTLGALGRLLLWQGRAALEGGQRDAHTRVQLERFRAVLDWRLGRQP